MTELSHSAVQGRLVKFMKENGWRRMKVNGKADGYVDEIFQRGKEILSVEIKPSYAGKPEIQKGIGQTVAQLPRNTPTALVCHITNKDFVEPVFQAINHPKLWLITYSDEGRFHCIKGTVEEEDLSWLLEDSELFSNTTDIQRQMPIPSGLIRLREPRRKAEEHRKSKGKQNFKCNRCGHTWTVEIKRGAKFTKMCPSCQEFSAVTLS